MPLYACRPWYFSHFLLTHRMSVLSALHRLFMLQRTIAYRTSTGHQKTRRTWWVVLISVDYYLTHVRIEYKPHTCSWWAAGRFLRTEKIIVKPASSLGFCTDVIYVRFGDARLVPRPDVSGFGIRTFSPWSLPGLLATTTKMYKILANRPVS